MSSITSLVFYRECLFLSTLLRRKWSWMKVRNDDVAVHPVDGVPAFWLLTSSHVIAEPMNVLVACGPYTPSDSLTFDPLLDLINVIVRDRPDVCLLV